MINQFKAPSQCATSHGLIQGLVKFDLGNVYHPQFGNIHVKSQFSRLNPKFQRKHVEPHDLEALVNKLLAWVNCHFETTGREEYFKRLALTSILYAAYCNPLPELYSTEMDLLIKFFFLAWHGDDEMEDAIEKNISLKELKQGTDQLKGILMSEYDTGKQFVNVPNCTQFLNTFNLLLDLHTCCKKALPEYEKRVDMLRYCIQRYFDGLRWYCVDEINERYSEETFKTWRKVITCYDGKAEFMALIQGISLPVEILESPTLKRILDISVSILGFVNDLLGMKNEFYEGRKDNFIVFKVLSKGIPLKDAVQQVSQLVDAELSDYILLKQVVLQEFDHEDNLVRYLDMLDSFIDGFNMVYAESTSESTRYRNIESVSLIR